MGSSLQSPKIHNISFIDDDLSALFVATMGKKAKSTAKIQKANDRKIDKSTLPPPPPPPEEEVRTFYKTSGVEAP